MGLWGKFPSGKNPIRKRPVKSRQNRPQESGIRNRATGQTLRGHRGIIGPLIRWRVCA